MTNMTSAKEPAQSNESKKVYDVSAVSCPANPGTDISARSYFDGVIEMERQELARRQKELELAKAKYFYMGAKL